MKRPAEPHEADFSFLDLLPELRRLIHTAINAPCTTFFNGFISWHCCCRAHYRLFSTATRASCAAVCLAKRDHIEKRDLSRPSANARPYANWAQWNEYWRFMCLCDALTKSLGTVGLALAQFVKKSNGLNAKRAAQPIGELISLAGLVEFNAQNHITVYGLVMLARARHWIQRHMEWKLVLWNGALRLAFPWNVAMCAVDGIRVAVTIAESDGC